MTQTSAAPAAADALPGPERTPAKRVTLAFVVLGGGASASIALLAATWMLMVALSWPHREEAGTPAWGINFDCDFAEFLLLEEPGGAYAPDDRPGRAAWCAATLGVLLDGLDARYVRLSVKWSEVEPREGEFDFSTIEAMLAEADRHGATVLLTVGMKAQRHPEYYLPGWALAHGLPPQESSPSDDPYLHDRALAMVETAVRRLGRSPAIEAWGAENEPFVVSLRSYSWQLTPEWVAEVAHVIRANDPLGRPVVVGHGQHFVTDRDWQDALEIADVLATSIYPFRNYTVLGREFVVPILEIGPIAPNYAHQAREARAEGKEYWITEMQAEPWLDTDARLVGPANPSPNLTASKFRRSVEYARKTGAGRVYLWGAEWWFFQRERYGDWWWWDLAKAAIATSPER